CEEILLNTFQNLLSLRIPYDRSSQSYLRVEFVNRPVRFHPRVLLSNSCPTIETRLPPITRPRVSFHQALRAYLAIQKRLLLIVAYHLSPSTLSRPST